MPKTARPNLSPRRRLRCSAACPRSANRGLLVCLALLLLLSAPSQMADTGARPARATPPMRSSESLLLDAGGVRYTRGTRASVDAGTRLATYSWELVGRAPRARVLLVHGFRSHTRFNFLASSWNGLHCYGGEGDDGFHEDGGTRSSFVRELSRTGFDVFAHDHYGHGDSGGLKTYFSSFDVLVDDVVAHARDLREGRSSHEAPWGNEEGGDVTSAADGAVAGDEVEEVPLYVVAHSMGGAVATLASQREEGVFDGVCLSSPASEAPPHMVGLWGSVLSVGAVLASTFLPQTEMYLLAKNTRLPDLQALFESDPLNSQICVRGRVGHEFLRAYRMIAASLDKMVVPFFTMSGGLDTLVHPGASRRFYKGAASKDKELNVREEFMHNLLTEPGKEENWELYIEWLNDRAPAIAS
jgi:acylglycerol lipase